MIALSLENAVMAIERVTEQLRRAASALEGACVPYAIIGGNAVGIWVASVDPEAVRNTKDVDVLLRRDDLAVATDALADAGFESAEVSGIRMFLNRDDPNPRRAIHVVFAGERVQPNYAHPAPSPLNAPRTPEGIAVIDLPALVTMKLQAYRDIDRVHIRDMLNVGLIDDATAAQIPADLMPRLEELRADPLG